MERPKVVFGNSKNRVTGYLTNEAIYYFELEGKVWPSVDHYVHARRFKGTQYEERIRQASSPWELRHLARSTTRIETNEKGRKSRGVYYREQHYGGAEEGGWYYHTLELQYYLEDEEETPKVVEEGTDAYGEGYVIWADFYIRENENLEKKFYC